MWWDHETLSPYRIGLTEACRETYKLGVLSVLVVSVKYEVLKLYQQADIIFLHHIASMSLHTPNNRTKMRMARSAMERSRPQGRIHRLSECQKHLRLLEAGLANRKENVPHSWSGPRGCER